VHTSLEDAYLALTRHDIEYQSTTTPSSTTPSTTSRRAAA